MLTDYHVHCSYSADCKITMQEQLDAARAKGVTHLCFADHADFDGNPQAPADLKARNEEMLRLAPLYPGIQLFCGMEIGMKDEEANRLAYEHAKDCHLDFIIGSLHLINGVKIYDPRYFEGKTKDEIVESYLSNLIKCAKVTEFSVLGHFDFCVKYAPYEDRSVNYRDYPDHFDELFRIILEKGSSIEMNTSAWQTSPAWGFDVLKRFRELGGEYITIGSDAHTIRRVGNRLEEAAELARAAGIPYLATFKNLKPVMHRL